MTVSRHFRKDDAESRADYSRCGAYRYALTRVWDPTGERLLFIMLNPSTATERQNDPTVERCERRAWALGYGAFRVVNIFAFRATDPRDLRRAEDPIGPKNDAILSEGAQWADLVLCAWGVHGAYRDQGVLTERKLRHAGYGLWHLGVTKDGHPRHPLYLPYRARPQRWIASARRSPT
ncbi:MAG: DUF1643 domain-containing protein [Pseudorhodobacter sp.]